MEKTYTENYKRYKDVIKKYHLENKEKLTEYNIKYQTNLRAQKRQERIKELQDTLGIPREIIEIIYNKGYILRKSR